MSRLGHLNRKRVAMSKITFSSYIRPTEGEASHCMRNTLILKKKFKIDVARRFVGVGFNAHGVILWFSWYHDVGQKPFHVFFPTNITGDRCIG